MSCLIYLLVCFEIMSIWCSARTAALGSGQDSSSAAQNVQRIDLTVGEPALVPGGQQQGSGLDAARVSWVRIKIRKLLEQA